LIDCACLFWLVLSTNKPNKITFSPSIESPEFDDIFEDFDEEDKLLIGEGDDNDDNEEFGSDSEEENEGEDFLRDIAMFGCGLHIHFNHLFLLHKNY
jgi:hypothetical protein